MLKKKTINKEKCGIIYDSSTCWPPGSGKLLRELIRTHNVASQEKLEALAEAEDAAKTADNLRTQKQHLISDQKQSRLALEAKDKEIFSAMQTITRLNAENGEVLNELNSDIKNILEAAEADRAEKSQALLSANAKLAEMESEMQHLTSVHASQLADKLQEVQSLETQVEKLELSQGDAKSLEASKCNEVAAVRQIAQDLASEKVCKLRQ